MTIEELEQAIIDKWWELQRAELAATMAYREWVKLSVQLDEMKAGEKEKVQ